MLQIFAPIGYTGYGYASINILKSFIKKYDDKKVSLLPIGQPYIDNQSDTDLVKQCLSNQTSMPYDTPVLKIWHQFQLLERIGSGKYIAFPFFELDKFSNNDIYNLNFPDHLIVSCAWAKNVLLNNSVKQPISIAPLGVDTTIFHPVDTKQTNNYVFCTIGKWEKRKAHEVIIHCFNKAFDKKDNVELWLLTHNGFLSQQEEQVWLNLVQQSKLSDKIKIFPRLPSHKDVAEIISYSNCGIYISRGEGWNMELLETMAMNRPVIVSNYSAHTEYCNSDNSYLVDIEETELAIDNKWFFGNNDANWAKLGQKQIDQTIDYMRYMYKNQINNNPNGVKTAEQYSWTNTVNEIVKIL